MPIRNKNKNKNLRQPVLFCALACFCFGAAFLVLNANAGEINVGNAVKHVVADDNILNDGNEKENEKNEKGKNSEVENTQGMKKEKEDNEAEETSEKKGEKKNEIKIEEKNTGEKNPETGKNSEEVKDGQGEAKNVEKGTVREKNKSTVKRLNEGSRNEIPEKDEKEKEGEGRMIGLVINEIMLGDGKSSKNEFIELYNFSNKKIDLDGFSLKKRTKSGRESNLVSSAKFSGSIQARGFFVIAHPNYAEAINADLRYSGASYSISRNNSIFLRNSDKETIDVLGWGECSGACVKDAICKSNPPNGQSLSRKGSNKPKSENAEEFEITSIVTPGEKNIFSSRVKYPKDIFLNEILPNPDGRDKNSEWVELRNENKKEISLDRWSIQNRSGKRFKLEDLTIKPKELRVIFLKNTSFVIRNSKENLQLIDPAGNIVDVVEIKGSAPSGISYGWSTERGWSWNRKISPGSSNVINKLPKIHVKKQKKIYKDTYAVFDASKTKDENGDKLKFRWDFGDEHRSYLKETRHKYAETGTFHVSLEVNDGYEMASKHFKIRVRKYPRYNLQIVRLIPNPSGSDRGNESVIIRNNTRKKINLCGYYVATGRNKRMSLRHPIYDDFIIGSRKEKSLKNSDICKFSLYNTKGAVVLLAPDGSRIDSVKYQKDKIGDDDIYFKNDDNTWEWIEAKDGSSKANAVAVIDKKTEEIQQQFQWYRVTRNEKLTICETGRKQKIANWINKRKTWLQYLEKILKTQIFVFDV
ncbi:MAG: lamin tail domain-containing protein [Patescibacteria group bacterium]|nr:lamin tail domain-containing protein [Patescibacteria group bacterium]